MPSYKLAKEVRDEIAKEAYRLFDLYRDNALECFPLTRQELQDAILTPEQAAAFAALRASGVTTITGDYEVFVTFSQDNHPKIVRGCVMNFFCAGTERIIFPRPAGFESQVRAVWSRYNPGTVFLMLDLDKEREVVAWANNAMRAARMHKMALSTFEEVMHIMDSTAMLVNTWKMLTTFVQDTKWRHRFYNMPQKNWDPKYHTIGEFKEYIAPRIRICDMMLNTALMVPPLTKRTAMPAGSLKATIHSMQALPTDKVFV